MSAATHRATPATDAAERASWPPPAFGPMGEGTGNGAPGGPPSGAAYPPTGTPDPRGQGSPATLWTIVRLVVVLAAIVAVMLLAGLGDLLVFIAVLALIVALHELGHFATAKWSHMKVTEFFIGFGPRLWSVRRGETDYGIKPILVGAYVKIPGMTNLDEVDPADEPRTYRRQPFHRRILVASAGSIVHYVLAFLLALCVVLAFGAPDGTKVVVQGFVSWAGRTQTAAQAGGLRTGDEIVAVDGRKVTTPAALSSDIQRRDGRPVTLTVTRAGTRLDLRVQPQAGHTTGPATTTEVLGPASGKGKTEWLVGVRTEEQTAFAGKNPLAAVAWAGQDVGAVTSATVLGLGHVFSPHGLASLYDQVTNAKAASQAAQHPTTSGRVMSVVGAARLATQAEQVGVYYFVSILIALNIVLGLLNMFPMLPLDGGHVAIAVYERIRTRRGRPYYQADVRKLLPVTYAFMAVVLLVVGSAVFLDIVHPIANPFG